MKYFSSSCVALVSTLFLLLITFTPTTTRAQPPATFKCSSTSSCQALVDYVPVNSTTYSDIKTLFGVENIHSIFGANSLPLSTSTNETVPAKQHIKIPFPCICNNGTGISNNRPLYSVKEGDSLDFIARTIFSNLVTYQQIATVNRIPNSVGIMVGYIELLIPLPCSCDEVDGMQVVHYEHVVRSGSSVQAIADEYGTTQSTLLRLNGLASANDLLADSVIDVPLQACTSVISNTSLDYPLVVPNGTYTFTANNCVQCTCTKANNLLECVPSPEGVNTPKQCPSMQCSNGLSLGNTSSATCGSTTCSYAGYTNDTNILTTLVGDLSCPRESRNSSKVVVIIVVPTVVVSVVFLSIVTIYFCLRRKNGNKSIEKVNEEEEIGSVESLQFNFRTIQEATNNFSDTNKLGKGGFGIVYKGVLSNGQEIAVKRLSRNSAQGIKEFKNEVILVVKLQHRNLVKLLGFCLEGDEKLLIYEFAPNGSLDHCIFG